MGWAVGGRLVGQRSMGGWEEDGRWRLGGGRSVGARSYRSTCLSPTTKVIVISCCKIFGQKKSCCKICLLCCGDFYVVENFFCLLILLEAADLVLSCPSTYQ